MSADYTPVVVPVTGSRGRAWMRHRLGRGRGHVLVVPEQAGANPTLSEARKASEAWWVLAYEQSAIETFEVPTGLEHERRVRVQVQVRWWVHDPRVVAHRRPVDGAMFVRRDVEARLRKAAAHVVGADDGRLEDELDAALSHPVALPEFGLSYRPAGVFHSADAISDEVRASLDHARWAVPLEREQQRLTRVRMDFHRELIREGPEALVAYWLTRFPDQIKAVLDHLDDHPPVEHPDRTLSAEMLVLLGDADDFERNHLRKSIALGLAGSGPRGRQVLEELGLAPDRDRDKDEGRDRREDGDEVGDARDDGDEGFPDVRGA